MGQYHLPISLTAQEKLRPSDYDDGNKLLEMTCSQDGVVKKLGELLQSSWKGHRIAIIGDYCAEDDLSAEALEGITLPHAVDLYDVCMETFNSPAEVDFISSNESVHVIYNLTKNEYLLPSDFGDSNAPSVFIDEGIDGGVMTAFFSLLAVSCRGGARGGGDIDSSSDLIGSWGGDRIAIVTENDLPENATNISSGMKDILVEAKEGAYKEIDDTVVRLRWDYRAQAYVEQKIA